MNGTGERVLPVVVGIDSSDGSRAAACWAATYARMIDAPLRLIHVVPDGDWYGSAAFVDGGALEDDLRRAGHEYLARASAEATAAAPGVVVEEVSADGTLPEVLAAIPSKLVVLGTPRTNAARDLLLGSNTIRVVNHVQSPVLVWRSAAGSGSDVRPIVVGVDGSSASDRAFSTALDMAHTLGAPLVGANYWGLAAQTGVGFAGIGFAAGYIDWDKVRTEEKLWLDTHVSAMREKFPDVKLSTVSASSSPARGLQALSSKALIVAVGSRGRGTLRGAALGSVSQNLLHHAESAVLIVR